MIYNIYSLKSNDCYYLNKYFSQYYKLCWVSEGEITIKEVDGEGCEALHSNSLFLLRKNSIQNLSFFSKSRDCKIIVVTLRDELLQAVCKNSNFERLAKLFSTNQKVTTWTFGQEDSQLINDFFAFLCKSNISGLLPGVMLFGLLNYLDCNNNAKDIFNEKPYITLLAELIKNNPRSHWNWDEVCRCFGQGKARIKQELDYHNIKLRDLVNSIRINLAMDMIRNGENRVKLVAFECGFASVSYFSTVFKNTLGITASDYIAMLEEL
ncbi:helix-turn-helix transcriptional regulator [Vibrio cholerae]|uniref:TCP pilus virulence regulatory protein ToxT, transcription activator n=2 Tax=Vibrio cholerae TaxID=666 RepID=H9CJG8_VIBCL|nr:TCP pilus virulence regulatory protein ToxT, transcription activator [Vibrio cholerae O37]EGQ7672822.1 helix-turn-helix transcriptional regulator [Vibrio cholerae]EKY32209.1 TCP pilus virulence regulatory protein ToxT, transcription activator [Vibrio cholerae PS15]KNA50564.1 transcriptional regulator [Vibrio cholerae MZO-3]EGQ7704511.1 helix-turn-helix transcriptional regulator [Vibrio cholerae]